MPRLFFILATLFSFFGGYVIASVQLPWSLRWLGFMLPVGCYAMSLSAELIVSQEAWKRGFDKRGEIEDKHRKEREQP
jgi:hypothetical protein